MSTTWVAGPSQNSWPRVFSCQAIPAASIRAMKSHWVNRFSAESAKRGFCDRNRSGAMPRLVKLHRPPPEIRIFSPGAPACRLDRRHHAGRPCPQNDCVPDHPRCLPVAIGPDKR
jgi:hypothetical protein